MKMSIERQIEALELVRKEFYDPVASCEIRTQTLHVNVVCAAYSQLRLLREHGYSTIVFGTDILADEIGIRLSITDIE